MLKSSSIGNLLASAVLKKSSDVIQIIENSTDGVVSADIEEEIESPQPPSDEQDKPKEDENRAW